MRGLRKEVIENSGSFGWFANRHTGMSTIHRSLMLCSCFDEVEVGNSSELDSGLARTILKILTLNSHFSLHENTTIVLEFNCHGLHEILIPIKSVYQPLLRVSFELARLV